MGWLDHSTNNIILDAVLTDYGRQRLASSRGDFKVTRFSLGDDEVDYRIIKKYGRTVGKEKIEKNTPIFEALTNQNVALKCPLVSVEDNGTSLSTSSLPYLTSNPATINLTTTDFSKDIIITQNYRITTSTSVNEAKLQKSYSIMLSDRFFLVPTSPTTNCRISSPLDAISRVSLGDPNRLVEYTITTDSQTQNTFSFRIQAKTSSIDSSVLAIYGTLLSTGERVITSNITIKGNTYGTMLDIPVTYTAKP